MKTSTEDRLWPKVMLCESRGSCLIWQNAKAGQGGYPVIYNGDRQERVSHVVLRLAGKQRPSELHVACHKCDTPACIAEDCLFWGTSQDNTIDALNKGRLKNMDVDHMRKMTNASLVKYTPSMRSADLKITRSKPGFHEKRVANLPRGDQHWSRRSKV